MWSFLLPLVIPRCIHHFGTGYGLIRTHHFLFIVPKSSHNVSQKIKPHSLMGFLRSHSLSFRHNYACGNAFTFALNHIPEFSPILFSHIFSPTSVLPWGQWFPAVLSAFNNASCRSYANYINFWNLKEVFSALNWPFGNILFSTTMAFVFLHSGFSLTKSFGFKNFFASWKTVTHARLNSPAI